MAKPRPCAGFGRCFSAWREALTPIGHMERARRTVREPPDHIGEGHELKRRLYGCVG